MTASKMGAYSASFRRAVRKTLTQHGLAVKTRDRIHQKFAVVDQRIVWYGSINLLSYGLSEESIMRIESMEIATELMGTV